MLMPDCKAKGLDIQLLLNIAQLLQMNQWLHI